MCSIENCELENFGDNDKCILHCEKENWNKDNENTFKNALFNKIKKVNSFKKTSLNKFVFPDSSKIIYDFFNDIAEMENEVIIEDVIFKNGFEIEEIFKNKIKFENCYFHGELFLNECTFNSDIEFKNCVFKEELNFGSSIFEKEFKIINSKENMNKDDYKISILHLSGAKFKNVVRLKRLNIKKSDFDNCIFEGEADFYKTDFNLTSFKRTVFKGYTIFNKSLLTESFDKYENINQNKFEFKNTKFKNVVSFDNVTLKKDFDLRSTLFYDKAIFLNLKKDDNENKISVSNRETARIIKDSFEQQNNIIEANKYYALEMEKREDELNQDRKEGKNFFEWLVFKVHGLASNHSQDWLLSLFWIFYIGFFVGLINFYMTKHDNTFVHFSLFSFIGTVLLIFSVIFIDCIRDKKESVKSFFLLFMFYLIYCYKTSDYLLYEVVKIINPFGKFIGLNIIELIAKVIIAYLIYQLIISIRQNTRRK